MLGEQLFEVVYLGLSCPDVLLALDGPEAVAPGLVLEDENLLDPEFQGGLQLALVAQQDRIFVDDAPNIEPNPSQYGQDHPRYD